MTQQRPFFTSIVIVNRFVVLVTQLQDVSTLGFLIAQCFSLPTVRYWQIVNEKVAPVRLGNDHGADNVLVCLPISDRVDRESITLSEIRQYFVVIGKIIPKLAVAAELQTFHGNVLAAVVVGCVVFGFDALPFLCKSGRHRFQPQGRIGLCDFF